mmetsp:Transcript_62785/g.150951  ORF Transcript_62785/g.150951 Transcript_62785/m.150951 type:complete len:215 (+) Transcript_62785:77-721(+)
MSVSTRSSSQMCVSTHSLWASLTLILMLTPTNRIPDESAPRITLASPCVLASCKVLLMRTISMRESRDRAARQAWSELTDSKYIVSLHMSSSRDTSRLYARSSFAMQLAIFLIPPRMNLSLSVSSQSPKSAACGVSLLLLSLNFPPETLARSTTVSKKISCTRNAWLCSWSSVSTGGPSATSDSQRTPSFFTRSLFCSTLCARYWCACHESAKS